MTTGEIIKNRRKELGFSAEYVAEKIGVSAATIYRYEKGDITKIPSEVLQKIADTLNVFWGYFFGYGLECDYNKDPQKCSDASLSDNAIAILQIFSELNTTDQAKVIVCAANLRDNKKINPGETPRVE